MHSTYSTSKLGLNPNQQIAVEHTEGALLIIAGPGAGKTKTLVERIVYLISQGVEASQIMVATFTEKAAKELITRVSNRLLNEGMAVNLNEMYIGTLHSIFLRFLEEYRELTRLKRSYRMLDQFDQAFLIFRHLKDYLEVEEQEELLGQNTSRWHKANDILGHVNKITEECINPDDLIAFQHSTAINVIGHFCKIYRQHLEDENALDFSTIQSETLHLLKNVPSVLADLQQRIRYVMVDEYQDTNTIQEKILFLLAQKSQNLCVVGDDDQGLYRFRGATIRNILEFPKNFPNCKQVELYTNYRSHPDIIDFYNEWMSKISWSKNGEKYRYDKLIEPRDADFTTCPAVIKVSSDGSTEDYYAEVYQFIRHLQAKGILKDLNQIAFLFRSVKHNDVIGLADYLEARGVPVFSPRSALFFEREEIRLMLGALITLFPDLFEILDFDTKFQYSVWDFYKECQKEFMEKIKSDKKKHAELTAWVAKRRNQHTPLTQHTNYAFAALMYQLLEFPMFADYLKTELTAHKQDLRPAYNLALLTKLLFKFEFIYGVSILKIEKKEQILRGLFNDFLRFIYEGGIAEYEDFDEYAPSGSVSFMTIHQSKGLEFPIVCVGSLHSGPRKSHTDIDEILQNHFHHKPPFEPLADIKTFDFQRLFYTAFSRPQNLLVLTAHEEYLAKPKKTRRYKVPSQYIEAMYEQIPYWHDKRFDASQLTLEEMKPTHIKHEYSFTSHVLLYENCPLQYKFYKELAFTEVRTGGVLGGSLIHQTIEDIHKAVLKKEEPTIYNDAQLRTWFDRNYELLSKQQRAYLHQAQIESLWKQILRYRNRNTGNWHTIVAAEVDVSLVKEDYILKGTIDLIQGENNTVEIVDFKSGDKIDVNDAYKRPLLDRYRRQLEIYAHLVEQRHGYKVSKMHLHFTKEENAHPLISFPFNRTDIDKTIVSFDMTVKKIENKDFDMAHIKKSEKQCGGCDMRYHCNPKYYCLK